MKYKPWNKEKKELFKRMYPIASWNELEFVFEMSKDSLLHRAKKMKLKRTHVNFKKFSQSEIRYLKDNYNTYSIRHIAEKLNRSEISIITKINQLKLK